MRIFREIPPTAGFRLRISDFFRFGKNNSLEKDFENYLSIPKAWVTSTGTTAFYIILEALKELSEKKTVVIPSFICPSIVYAIARAGLKTQICDIQPDNFDFDFTALENICANTPDLLAVVGMHLSGLPGEMAKVEAIAKKHDAYFIEDAAQALGVEYAGRKAGSIGDFNFFSMCRGKGLTTFEGGVLTVTKSEYVPLIDNVIKRLEKPAPLNEFGYITGLFTYWLFYRPELLWFVFKLPQYFWTWRGEKFKAMAEHARIDFPVEKVSHYRKSIAHASFQRLSRELAGQRRKFEFYYEYLHNNPNFKILTETPGSRASYPYATLLFKNVELRNKAMDLLDEQGLGPFIVYVHAIPDYEYLKPYMPNTNMPNGRNFAQCSITISTSAFLKDKEIAAIVATLKNI